MPLLLSKSYNFSCFFCDGEGLLPQDGGTPYHAQQYRHRRGAKGNKRGGRRGIQREVKTVRMGPTAAGHHPRKKFRRWVFYPPATFFCGGRRAEGGRKKEAFSASCPRPSFFLEGAKRFILVLSSSFFLPRRSFVGCAVVVCWLLTSRRFPPFFPWGLLLCRLGG